MATKLKVVCLPEGDTIICLPLSDKNVSRPPSVTTACLPSSLKLSACHQLTNGSLKKPHP
eukprot:1140848-Pelagomonas_calceolata.AAC.2